jgi:hypothetical protein
MAEIKRGRPEKLGDHQSYTLRLPVDLHRQLRHFAVDKGVSMNDILVQVIEGWWKDRPERASYTKLKSTAEPRRPRKPSE